HVVYGVHEPRSKRVYVAFAVMALPGQSNKNVRLQAVGDLPRIPRVWKGSRVRESCKVLAFAALAAGIWTYCGLTDPRGGVEMAIEADGFVALSCAIYFAFAASAAIRWHFGWFTRRQLNLLAVYDALGVPARGKDRAETSLI
ncbi:hypothetical protein, partial [Paraburkholderia ginsengiterrae]|uniref:hypothetical protein n=1 Tax=Paraburkholderia ginsengiterrae TaxID=1462993 RepID=UPI000B033185